MYSSIGLVKKITGVKCTHIEEVKTAVCVKTIDGETFEQQQIIVQARPWKRIERQCPICRRKCPGYDTKSSSDSQWRGPNINGMPLYFRYTPRRISCPEHGVRTEYIPWADGSSRFLEAFNNEATYLAMNAAKTVVAEYLGINWRTVGNCIKAAHDRLEPDLTQRLRGVKRICVDETSYKKGHKYITVVIDMDTGNVIWIREDRGDEVFKQFCLELTEEERKQITIVAGDGAQWIDRQTKDFFPNAKRCVDPFHVVGWINEALDSVRKSVAARARNEASRERNKIEEEAEQARIAWMMEYEKYLAAVEEMKILSGKRGRKSAHFNEQKAFISAFEEQYGETMDLLKKQKKGQLTEEQKARLAELDQKAANIKGCKYALGMNPENLNDRNTDRLELIKASSPELYEAYKLKETLRVIIHMNSREEAEKALNEWIEAARNSGFKSFEELADKIQQRTKGILNSIETGSNSAKSEQTNGRIKGLIHVAHGFRNLENMFSMIYLCCSDIVVPLSNRYRPSAEKLREKRERAARLRSARQKAKQAQMSA